MQPEEGFNAVTHLTALLFQVFTPEQLGDILTFIHEQIHTQCNGELLGIAHLPVRSPAMWEKLKFFSKKRWSVLIFVILLRQTEMASWSISNPKHHNIIYLSICTI